MAIDFSKLTTQEAEAAFHAVKNAEEGVVTKKAVDEAQNSKDLTPVQKALLQETFNIQKKAPKGKTDDSYDDNPATMEWKEFLPATNWVTKRTVFDPKAVGNAEWQSSALYQAMMSKTGALSNVFGPGGLGKGISEALANLRDLPAETAPADLGYRGTGAGGGGSALGIGGLGSHGSGKGTGGFGNVQLSQGSDRGTGPARPDFSQITRDQIKRVMKRAHSQVRYVYEMELQKNPRLQGKVVFTFTIKTDGTVDGTKDGIVVDETKITFKDEGLNSPAVIAGLRRVIGRLRFPAASKTTDVTYPFLLTATTEKPAEKK